MTGKVQAVRAHSCLAPMLFWIVAADAKGQPADMLVKEVTRMPHEL